MNSRIKKLWLKALRSGEYKQTKNVLKDEKGFCCLGVLCDIHRKVTKTKGNVWGTGPNEYAGDVEGGALPALVRKWAGLEDCNPTPKGCKNSLAQQNDKGKTFKEIAKIIEKGL